MDKIYIYGAPACGKTTFGKKLAMAIDREFVDLDEMIVAMEGRKIGEIFASEGEAYFRKIESKALEQVAQLDDVKVVALGGGTLLSVANRALCEKTGQVFALESPDAETLVKRIDEDATFRPLGDKSKERALHYASFENRIHSYYEVLSSLVVVGVNIKDAFLDGQIVVDEMVANLYPEIKDKVAIVPSGEIHKNAQTLSSLYDAFQQKGIGRCSIVTAIGGGVVLDLAGFAAATWMRGVDWINMPTTLLSMVDASIGGKTGYDLKSGKNLVGAFHPPRLVVIDTCFLSTLPEPLLAQGRAEMIKHQILGAKKTDISKVPSAAEIAENIAVKAMIVNEDPYEKNDKRLLLNCGHTIAHAVEKVSSYSIGHGDAVAIGLVEEARIAVLKKLAPEKWVEELVMTLKMAGLKVQMPKNIDFDKLKEVMRGDKKHKGDTVRFALPCAWGDVRAVDIDLSKEDCFL